MDSKQGIMGRCFFMGLLDCFDLSILDLSISIYLGFIPVRMRD
jgi:hypothetical protein